jgi:hypothetical protein
MFIIIKKNIYQSANLARCNDKYINKLFHHSETFFTIMKKLLITKILIDIYETGTNLFKYH